MRWAWHAAGRWTPRALVTMVLGASLGACASPGPGPTTAPSATQARPATGAGSVRGGPATGSVMQVNVRSGTDEGSHYAFSATPTCTYGPGSDGADRADSWATAYAAGKADLSALRAVVPSGAEATVGEGTRTFLFDATVNGTHFVIDTSASGGTRGGGLAKVIDFGRSGIITVDGRTADGIRVDATIQCNSIAGR